MRYSEFQKQLTLQNVSAEACAGHKQMSAKYVTMDTKALGEALLSLQVRGEKFFELREIKMRRGKAEHAWKGTHMVRIKTIKPLNTKTGEELYPELLIQNSYDGSASLKVDMGIFRLVCSNGLVIKTRDFGGFKLRHVGTPMETALDLLRQFAARCTEFVKVQETLSLVQLTDEQIERLAREAAKLRWNREITNNDVLALTAVTRPEDEGNGAWEVFNRIQEKIMVGGVKLEGTKRPTKGFTVNVSGSIKLNKELFEIVMEIAAPEAATTPDETAEIVQLVEAVEETVDIPTYEPAEDGELVQVAVAPPKKIRKTINGVRQYIDNPAYIEWMSTQN